MFRPSTRAALALSATAVAAALSVAPARAATDAERLQALEKRFEQSQQLIDALQRRLAELEGQRAAAAPAAAAAAVAAADPGAATRIDALEKQVSDMANAAAHSKPADSGVPLHGFLDVDWARHSAKAPADARNGYKLGTLDFYLTPQLGEHVRSLVELAFEYGPGGGLGIDAERLQIGYEFSDALVLWAGRFHTPYGYWNTAFHHGAQIQTSITRPKMIAFEDQGGILPSHAVGVWATGKLATGAGRVSYDLYMANGNRISDGVLDYNASGDNNGNPLIGFNLGFSPKAVPGLTVGLHGLRQTVEGENADATATGRVRSQMLGGYAFFENDDWEVIGELYRFKNRNLIAGGSHGSTAGFVQVGRSLAPQWTGFVRAERASLSTADPYFTLQESGSSYSQWTVGLRYDLDPRSSLKLQLERNRDAANANQNVSWARAQYAIRF